MQNYEILGQFYLGKVIDPATMTRSNQYLLYDSRDLTTHAICIGMTGSGKTGLGINLLEEAAMDNIPALIIDPKGDMGNLLLTFPELSPSDFLPWIQASDAERKGLTLEDYAAAKAESWKNGLAEWNQDGDRIRNLKSKSDFTIYTPGSTVGMPLSIVSMLDSPNPNLFEDQEMIMDYASSTVSSLLSLIGIDADPLQSKEHILLTNILLSQWQSGQNINLASLIQQIIQPAIDKIGILPLDKFLPENERMNLAMRFNNLLAAPQFSAWLDGEALNIQNLLYTSEGKPRMSILSLNHLSDQERMFFVSLLLNQIIAWLRTQSGTSSLRAILYMDEIFGFVPPVANPPSKKPMLTLLKQARAFGLGVVLATQNPVDIDYKGLSNIGSWFVGRLQTDQDKNRLLDGLQMASQSNSNLALNFDRQELSKLLSNLPSRAFLLNNVHDSSTLLFETRWCLSYLAGPLNRQQIASLKNKAVQPISHEVRSDKLIVDSEAGLAGAQVSASVTGQAKATNDNQMIEDAANQRPTPDNSDTFQLSPEVPSDIIQYYLPADPTSGQVTYTPTLYAHIDVTFENKKPDIFETITSDYMTVIDNGVLPVRWENSKVENFDMNILQKNPVPGANYLSLHELASKKSSYTAWQKDLVDQIFRTESYTIYSNEAKTMFSKANESKAEFLIRLRQENRELRDTAIENLRQKYDKKLASLGEKVRKAEQALEREKDQASQAKFSSLINLGTTVLDGLLGNKKGLSKTTMTKAGMAARSVGRSRQQSGDVSRAQDSLATYQADLENLELELEKEIATLNELYADKEEIFQEITVKAKKKDILVKIFALVWKP